MNASVLIRHIDALKPGDVEEMLGRDHVIRRSETYADEGRVEEIWIDGPSLRAHVTGSSSTPYHCVVRLHEGEIESECSCPYNRGICWHVGATLLVLISDPQLRERLSREAQRKSRVAGAPDAAPAQDVPGEGAAEASPTAPVDPETPAPPMQEAGLTAGSHALPPQTSDIDVDELATRLMAVPKQHLGLALAEFAARDPLVEARVNELTADPTDLDLRLYRQAARAALRPGRVLGRYEAARVAADIRDIVKSVERLIMGAQAERALDLLEEIAWTVFGRLEEVEDRDGVLARMVHDVLVAWCHGWSDVEARDRQQIARQLFGWLMEDSGGVTRGLVIEAKNALGNAGLQSLQGLLQPVLEERRAQRASLLSGEHGEIGDPVAERARDALREVAEARGELETFLELCRPDGHHGGRVVEAASRLARAGRLEEAVALAKSGVGKARGSERAALDELQIKLLSHLGRRAEAGEVAWESFLAEPGAVAMRRLLEAAGETERGEWRRRALDTVDARGDATAFVEVCVAAEDLERLSHRLESVPDFMHAASPESLELAIDASRSRRPILAARLHVVLAERLLLEADPRRHDAALDHLRAAENYFEGSAKPGAWDEILAELRRRFAVVAQWYPALG